MTAIATTELRQRAIEAYRSQKGTQKQIAKLFGITERAFQKWLKAYRLENRIEPLRRGHNPAAFEGDNLKALDECVARRPDITLDELKEIFASRVNCSRITIHNTLRRLKWEYKKSRYERVSKADQM